MRFQCKVGHLLNWSEHLNEKYCPSNFKYKWLGDSYICEFFTSSIAAPIVFPRVQ